MLQTLIQRVWTLCQRARNEKPQTRWNSKRLHDLQTLISRHISAAKYPKSGKHGAGDDGGGGGGHSGRNERAGWTAMGPGGMRELWGEKMCRKCERLPNKLHPVARRKLGDGGERRKKHPLKCKKIKINKQKKQREKEIHTPFFFNSHTHENSSSFGCFSSLTFQEERHKNCSLFY